MREEPRRRVMTDRGATVGRAVCMDNTGVISFVPTSTSRALYTIVTERVIRKTS